MPSTQPLETAQTSLSPYPQGRAGLGQEQLRAEELLSGSRSISVVVPVYNSESILPVLAQRLELVLASLSDEQELILVNDGSRDRSWEMIQRLSNQYPWVHGMNLMRNYGQHNALLGGIRAAAFDVLIPVDDDLQHPPDEIPQLLAKLEGGFELSMALLSGTS